MKRSEKSRFFLYTEIKKADFESGGNGEITIQEGVLCEITPLLVNEKKGSLN